MKLKTIENYKGIDLTAIYDHDTEYHFSATGCPWMFERLDSVKDYIDDKLERKAIRINKDTNGMLLTK